VATGVTNRPSACDTEHRSGDSEQRTRKVRLQRHQPQPGGIVRQQHVGTDRPVSRPPERIEVRAHGTIRRDGRLPGDQDKNRPDLGPWQAGGAKSRRRAAGLPVNVAPDLD
jgi:hypothetical protein